MKVLIINSRYFLSAGPEKYLFGLEKILQEKNHKTIIFSTKNSKNKKNKFEKYFADPISGKDEVYFNEYKINIKTIIQILSRQFYSFYIKKRADILIKKEKPDIAYLLHHYNKLSPSVIDACKKNNVPIVMRISDYSMVCPEGHLYREKKPCEKCINKSLFYAIKYKCVKKSFIGSLIKVAAIKLHRIIRIYNKVNHIVFPSKFTMDKLRPFVKKMEISHIPTFIMRTEKYNQKIGDYMLFVGRLEENKGVMNAIVAVKRTQFKLKIVGDSSSNYGKEIKEYVRKNKLVNVEFMGNKQGDELRKIYQSARFVIIPSLWYENLPNVALEAMIHSKPILASNLGSMKEIIKEGYNGIFFDPNNIKELRKKTKLLFESQTICQEMGINSYHEAITKYNPYKHYNKLIRVFTKVINDKKKRNETKR